jgi:ArsR family transcriptional regulator
LLGCRYANTMNAKKFGRISRALSDPNRLMILEELKQKEHNCLYCVDIYGKTNLAQPSVSHHLKLLTDAEIIIPEKQGRTMKYTLNYSVLDDYILYLQGLKR